MRLVLACGGAERGPAVPGDRLVRLSAGVQCHLRAPDAETLFAAPCGASV